MPADLSACFGPRPYSPAMDALVQAYGRRQSIVAAALAEGMMCGCGEIRGERGCTEDHCTAKEDV